MAASDAGESADGSEVFCLGVAGGEISEVADCGVAGGVVERSGVGVAV